MTTETGLLIGAGALVILLLVLMTIRARRRQSRGVPVVDWEVRAQLAERRAEQAEAAVKAGLIPHLAQLLRNKLVTGLLGQRRQLMAGQEEGTGKAEALEGRLAAAHEGLQQKLSAYEAKLGSLKQAERADQGSAGTGQEAAPERKEPPRRNPLVSRPAQPPPEPVEFSKIVARRREEGGSREPIQRSEESDSKT